jgi:hypothetical protein
VSEEAAPLAYPPGGWPQEKFLVPLRPPEPVPPLGVRLLPWHIAGQFDEKSETWLSLRNYAAQLNRVDETGWVQLLEQTDGTLVVRAGFHDQTLLRLSLHKGPQGHWTYQPQRYECKDGGLVVYGAFPPPPQENPTGQAGAVGAKCTFYRAVDGSLVMLEDAYAGVAQGTMLFQKWWRWRLIEPGRSVISP